LDQTNIRVKEHCGLVTNDTSTDQFSFLISPLRNRAAVEKQSFIMIDHPVYGDVCPVLALVKEIKSYEEVAGSTLGDRIGKMLATAEVVGYLDNRGDNKPMCELLIPPNPGSRVYMPYNEFIEDALSRNPEGESFKHKLHLGTTDAYATTSNNEVKQINFYLDSAELMSGHTLIAAVGGAGKTHTAAVLIEELANKTQHPIVILDAYGEYKNTAPAKISTKTLPQQLTTLSPEKAERQIREALQESINANRITIVNAAGLTAKEKQALFERSINALLEIRFEGKVKPVFVVVENADNLKLEFLESAAQEGRKAGVSLCLLSTHPTDLGGIVLSNTAMQFLGRTTDKDDVEYLRNMAGGADALLPGLIVSEWVVSHTSAKQPTKVTIRKK
jgi:DNA helicase HerA-like ATPase